MPSWTESLTAGSLLKPVDPNEPFLLRNKINRALYWVIEKQKSLESYDPAWVLASYEDRDLEYHSTKGFWRGQLEKYFQPIRIRELTPPAKLILPLFPKAPAWFACKTPAAIVVGPV
jgi:hypothetical protein